MTAKLLGLIATTALNPEMLLLDGPPGALDAPM
jgi:ABC-type taurine transport system ATPase subunit